MRAEWLPPRDRALVEAVYRDGRSIVDVATPIDLDPRAARRRLRRLRDRLLSQRTLFVAQQRTGWAPTRRRVAEACVLHGLSMREAARKLGISLHSIRRHCHAIDAQFEAVGIAARHGSRGGAS